MNRSEHITFPSAVLKMMEKVRERFLSRLFTNMAPKYYRAEILVKGRSVFQLTEINERKQEKCP